MNFRSFSIILLFIQLNFNYFAGTQSFNTVKRGINPKISRNVGQDTLRRVATALKEKTEKTSLKKNHRSVHSSFRLHLPLKSIFFTSFFGQRFHPVLGRVMTHNGVDLRADYQPVYSISKGVVARTGKDKRSGNYVVINNFGGIETVFCHLAKILVKTGDTLPGETIFAISGATGTVTDPHLHFGLKVNGRFVDPRPVLLAIEKRLELGRNNIASVLHPPGY